jgi:hypothetical protein
MRLIKVLEVDCILLTLIYKILRDLLYAAGMAIMSVREVVLDEILKGFHFEDFVFLCFFPF